MKEIFKEQHFKQCNNCNTRFEIEEVVESCPHCGYGDSNCDFSFIIENDCESAENKITGKRYHNWFCKDSTDHLCHYDNEIIEDVTGTFVFLLNGEKEYLKDFDEEDHYWESCLFCGAPEERK